MNEKQLTQKLKEILTKDMDEHGHFWTNKIALLKRLLTDIEIETQEWDCSRAGQPFEKEELDVILNTRPHKDAILTVAKAFKRPYYEVACVVTRNLDK